MQGTYALVFICNFISYLTINGNTIKRPSVIVNYIKLDIDSRNTTGKSGIFENER